MMKMQNTEKEIDFSESIKKKIMKIKLFSILLIIALGSFSVTAQETWSLVKCIDYALANNVDLTISFNNAEMQRATVLESKAKLLPTLNMGSGVNYSFGRSIDLNTNTITFDQTMYNNYGLYTSVDLFNGFIKLNTIGFNKYLLSANKEEATYIKNKLVFDILISYCTVLYSKGLREVAKSQLVLSESQYQRMQKLVDIGRESPITVQELKSQWATDKFSLTIAENNFNKTLLQLKQLLKLDAVQSFEIEDLGLNSTFSATQQNIDSLFKSAVNVLPEIKQQEFLFKASVKELAIAKGGVSPRIYLSAGLYTNYFDGDPLEYSKQMDNNQSQAVAIGITIPIFNNASVYSDIKRKRIMVKDRELLLQKQKDILYSEIWNAIDELQSANNEYQSAEELYDFSKLALENATKKLEKGLASPTDYEVAKQRFVSAQASLLKAKIVFYMRKQMLQFYKTGNWNHINQ
ncbi:MAG: TolC family protein [Candidatus Atribacteria bacterium]|nr:TolC family protein [Candidatus Atribacteria bacterium]